MTTQGKNMDECKATFKRLEKDWGWYVKIKYRKQKSKKILMHIAIEAWPKRKIAGIYWVFFMLGIQLCV